MGISVAVWFELPANDVDRAQAFYETVLGHPMKRELFQGMDMAVFQIPGAEATGCVIKGEQFRPSAAGTIVYLDAGPDLAGPLSRVVKAGGEVAMPKTDITPFGFIAVIRDSEGNSVGLHSLA